MLGYPDSNQERQDQNLQCYHYTIAQSIFLLQVCHDVALFLVCKCKGMAFFLHVQTFEQKNVKKILNSYQFFVGAP